MSTMTAETVDTVDVRDRADIARQIKQIVVFAIVTVLLTWFALTIDDGHVLYTMGRRVTKEDPAQTLNGMPLVWISLVIAVVALVLAAVNRVPKGWLGMVVYLLVGAAFFAGFMIWMYADQEAGRDIVMQNPMPETIKLATPLILGALAGVMCERAGVINIAIEGQFLMGAFFASVASSMAYSAEMGLVGGILAGVAMSALLAVFAMRYLVNQVVLGVVLIALATGLTSFFLSQIPAEHKEYLNTPLVLPPIEIPFLSKIPVIGSSLFEQSLLVYLMYASVVLVTWLLFQTKWGLRVRSVGEHPKAADTVGIKVNRTRWQAVLLGGVFAGLGGAYFTVGSTGAFDNGASAGNGFIALAAVIMGRWHPVWASISALFFGLMWTLQAQLAFLDKIPGELLRASPYLATIIAVAGFVGRVRPPAADGEPYVKS
ncbi:MAG: ABC transporter permease [Nocardioides sp.]|uniref:ABC transporter permease n=1 Tax=Nocardioides sp. TaxID=35761 RepID=UPI003F092A49